MNCLKCGRETEEHQCFCPSCLENAEKYPVPPGTSVHIPTPPVSAPVKKPRRAPKVQTPEQQIHHLRASLRTSIVIILVLFVGFVLTAGLTIHLLNLRDKIPLGRNFATPPPSTTSSSEPSF